MGGRLLSEEDVAGMRKVAVVNQTFASKYFPGESPIGRQVKLARTGEGSHADGQSMV